MRGKRSDNIFTGIIAGLIVPVIAFGTLSWFWYQFTEMGTFSDDDFSPGFKVRTLGLLSIAANLILIRYFQNRYALQSVRGTLIPTFIFVIVWILYFARAIL